MLKHLKKSYSQVVAAFNSIKHCFQDVSQLKTMNLYNFIGRQMDPQVTYDLYCYRYQFAELLVKIAFEQQDFIA
jgi:hypothetical protein